MNENICYSFNAAIDKAIEMEEGSFRNYLTAISIVQNRHARDLLRDSSLEEVRHKHELEIALLHGAMAGRDELEVNVPTLNLDYLLDQHALRPEADVRQALAYSFTWKRAPSIFISR